MKFSYFDHLRAALKAAFFLAVIAVVWAVLIVLSLPLQLPLTFIPLFVKSYGNTDFVAWRYNFWVGQDQYINAMLGGDRDISISSRIGWLSAQGSLTGWYMEHVVDWLFKVFFRQDNHCFAAIERDEKHSKTWGGV